MLINKAILFLGSIVLAICFVWRNVDVVVLGKNKTVVFRHYFCLGAGCRCLSLLGVSPRLLINKAILFLGSIVLAICFVWRNVGVVVLGKNKIIILRHCFV
ncbi:hypothetical protein CD148_06660 [Staphylococcus delphini]|uniref:Uncharacterized protein n=1 Tax=Staphylococcus delphini TaxID=53344 RepID=A0AAX0QXP1_9STAP|nr:hypothetical protein [Staphylococcus delphini]PCF52274.1 hypothetical protein B5C07_02215 [Staphylococcus delphini]PNZ94899.1 hypothetical protein CD148_06660 [Staphylococcus delphini]